MAAFQNLPWIPSSDQFLRAIIAGSQAGASRSRGRLDDDRGRPVTRMIPQFARTPAIAAAAPTDPHLALSGSILQVVDPQAQAAQTAPVAQAAPQPFDVGGQQFITNPVSGEAQPYVEPSSIEKVGSDLVRVFPKSFRAEQIYEGSNTAGDAARVSVPVFPEGVNPLTARALGMTPTMVRGSLDQVAPIVGTNLPPSLSGERRGASEVIRMTTSGRRAVFDANTKKFLRYAD